MKRLALSAIKLYQATRVLRAPTCRFYPSCSCYVAGAIERFGLTRGAAVGLCRLLRCHPFNPGGVDVLPERFIDGLTVWHTAGAEVSAQSAAQRG